MLSPPEHSQKFALEPPPSNHTEMGEDAMQFLWAISYSDLLMVMLTFFIIFFEFTEVTETSPMDRLISDLKTKAGLQVIKGGGAVSLADTSGPSVNVPTERSPRETSPAPNTEVGRSLTSLEDELKQTALVVTKVGDKKDLVVHFPDNIYALGEFRLTPSGQKEVQRIMELIKPYANNVAVVFVGHTDDFPVKVFHQHIIDSNMVLSNLRSSYAVNYAIQLGFDPRWVSAQGMAEYSRNTRSLSVRLMERGSR